MSEHLAVALIFPTLTTLTTGILEDVVTIGNIIIFIHQDVLSVVKINVDIYLTSFTSYITIHNQGIVILALSGNIIDKTFDFLHGTSVTSTVRFMAVVFGLSTFRMLLYKFICGQYRVLQRSWELFLVQQLVHEIIVVVLKR